MRPYSQHILRVSQRCHADEEQIRNRLTRDYQNVTVLADVVCVMRRTLVGMNEPRNM